MLFLSSFSLFLLADLRFTEVLLFNSSFVLLFSWLLLCCYCMQVEGKGHLCFWSSRQLVQADGWCRTIARGALTRKGTIGTSKSVPFSPSLMPLSQSISLSGLTLYFLWILNMDGWDLFGPLYTLSDFLLFVGCWRFSLLSLPFLLQ